MRVIDTRRLTGPNLFARVPLVIVELAFDEGDDLERARGVYASELARMRGAVGLPTIASMIVRPHQGGAVIANEEAIDIMLAAAEASEWAALSATEVLAGRASLALESKRAEIVALLAQQRNPRLLALAAQAKARGLPFLWDDEAVTIGAGRRSKTFALGAIPDVADVAFGDLGSIPIALVTGTNGKTTSSRLLARVAKEAGFHAGNTTSDGIAIDGVTIESGDWTGPSAAREVLRRDDVDLAVLETARGGILRRGLAVDGYDCALVTNVSDDHLGLYGIDDVAAMTRVKAVIADAVRDGGTVVLNAHDPNLAALAPALAASGRKVTFFADLDGDGIAGDEAAHGVIRAHRASGGEVVVAEGGDVVCANGMRLIRIDDVPITFGGAARYNVENALGVVAAARALGLPNDAIARGLRGFDVIDNPRRGELLEHRGVRVLLDFGHNPAGVRAVMRLVAARRGAGRLTVITGSAGDRSDRDIEAIAEILVRARPDRIFVRELPDYLRGRALGDVPAIFRRAFGALGFPESEFAVAASETDALRRAFADASPGDFVVLLIHVEHDEVRAFLG